MKKILSLLLLVLGAASLQASVLFQDSTNYPYTNGPIAGQGQWYIYSYAGTNRAYDTLVTNNTIYLVSTNLDSVATPTNGFYNPTNGSVIWASFTLNVSKLPGYNSDGYFATLISTNKNYCCNVFVTRTGTVTPNSFRMAIASYSVSFSNLKPPVILPRDLATNVTYTVVIAFDTQQETATTGANLLVDPSAADYNNLIGEEDENDTGAYGYVYGDDSPVNSAAANINITAIGFGPYVNAGFSNVIIGTTFFDVYNTTNIAPPVFGIQPLSATNYSGNPLTLYSLAGGADLTYQWYSTTYGTLTDGATFTGSMSNILVISSLAASDTYYVIATDANGQTTTSSNAVETVITTPTPVFFGSSVTATNTTNNLFTTVTFTDTALGTGPIGYQWYFKYSGLTNAGLGITNAGATTFTPLSGQTSNTISLYLGDFTYPGLYFVVASNSINGGSLAYGPTNSLFEIAPQIATLAQLHSYLSAAANQIAGNPNGTIYINSNNVTASGYVSVYQGYGSSYSEFFIQDSNGYGCEVFLSSLGNTNTPPIGTYVTVSGELEVYHSGLELAPTTLSAIVISNSVAPIPIYPILGNSLFTNLAENPTGSNALRYSESIFTFTNVYLYGSASGGALGAGGSHYGVGGYFVSNSYTDLYITVGGPYSTSNTNVMEIFQPSYNINGSNQFNLQTIPTHLAQLTGVLLPYGTYIELIPSRYVDYASNSPAPFTTSISVTNKTATLKWSPTPGNTYSVNATTNATVPYITEAYGLTYYPTNGVFSEPVGSNTSKFFQITSP